MPAFHLKTYSYADGVGGSHDVALWNELKEQLVIGGLYGAR